MKTMPNTKMCSVCLKVHLVSFFFASQAVLVVLDPSMRQERLAVPTGKSKANMQSKAGWPELSRVIMVCSLEHCVLLARRS